MGNRGDLACLFRLCGLVLDRLADRRYLGHGFFRRWGHYLVRVSRVKKETRSVTVVWLRQRNNPLASPDPSIILLTQFPSQFRFICATSLTRSVGGSGKGEGQKLGL